MSTGARQQGTFRRENKIEIKMTRKRKNERQRQSMVDDRCEEREGMKVRTLP